MDICSGRDACGLGRSVSKLNDLENCQSLYERLEESNYDRRTSLLSRNNYLLDVSRASAAKQCRQNWDGCRELWKRRYRQRKERRSNPHC